MKHFRVLQYDDVDKLAEAIEQALNDSWKLAGEMFVSPPTYMAPVRYNQPIIKTTREETR